MEKGRESGPSSAAYPTWDIRSEKRDCEQRSTMEKGGVHVKRKSALPLGEECCGAVRECFRSCLLGEGH